MKAWLIKLLLPMIAVIVLLTPSHIVHAAGLAIEYNGKSVSYTGTQVRYSLDGEMITTLYPGIIINDISLAPLEDVFIQSGTGIKYKYNENKGTIKLTYGQKTIQFTLGQSTGLVNGKEVRLPATPYMIYFPNKDTHKLYVPARFVAENFGFTYVWNYKTGIASLTSPATVIRYNGKDHTYTGRKLQVESGDIACTKKNYYGLTINDVVMVPAKITFAGKGINGSYGYDKNTKTITISKYGVSVQMTLNSKTAFVNGQEIKLPEAPRKIKFRQTGKSKIYVPLQAVIEALHYEYLPFISKNHINLIKPYAIKYNGEWKFPAVKGRVACEGNAIDVAPAYSFIESNTALIAAEKTFKDGMNCYYAYDEEAGVVTISYQSNMIIYYLDSTIAFLNGAAVDAPVAPRLVKYDTDGSYVMVPGRFTANSLGLEYEWKDAESTSYITAPKVEEPEKPVEPETPEEPDAEDIVPVPDTPEIVLPEISLPDETLFQWNMTPEYEGVVQQQAAFQPEQKISGRKQGDIIAYTSLIGVQQLQDAYQLISSDGFFDIKASMKEGQLELILSETIAADYIYLFTEGTFTQAAVNLQAEDLSTRVVFDFSENATKNYSLSLSEDHKILTVQTYRTYLTSITGIRKNGEDIISIKGNGDLKAELVPISNSEDLICLQLDGVIDTLANTDVTWNTQTMSGGVNFVTRIPINDTQMQLLIQKNSNFDLYMVEASGQVRLTISNPDAINSSLQIPYMPGTNPELITDKDEYMSHSFTITLPGDQTGYLQANPITKNNDVISKVTTKLNKDGNTVVTVTTSRLQAYKLHITSYAVMVEIGDPKDLYDKIVVLDAGHGGNDPGTIKQGVNEKDLNLQIIYERMEKYFKDSDIKAYWTREDDTFLSLNDRAAYAGKVGADFFVSLHMNSYTNGTPKGLSVFYATRNTSKTSGGLDSKTLAGILQKNLISGLKANDREVKTSSFVVCRSNTVPAVLIELGFMSNANELSQLTDASYQEKAAQQIYLSIAEAFEKYPTGR